MKNYTKFLTQYQKNILYVLGIDTDGLQYDRITVNPLYRAIKDGSFWEKLYAHNLINLVPAGVETRKDRDGNKIKMDEHYKIPEKQGGMESIAILATVLQMYVYKNIGGPQGSHELRTLRTQWYDWFKQFAQAFAVPLGKYDLVDGQPAIRNDDWDALQSKIYAKIVRMGAGDPDGITYKDLWVKDNSRKVETIYNRLFEGFPLILCCEKEGEFDQFVPLARKLGAAGLVGAAGKPAFAAIEGILRDVFGWTPDYDPFSEEYPLIFLVISDYDRDGEEIINGSFETQARRYTPWVKTARIGIDPDTIAPFIQIKDALYSVKLIDEEYKRWAKDKALYLVNCDSCNDSFITKSIYTRTCPTCGALLDDYSDHVPYGLEVEAANPRNFDALAAQALLTVVDFYGIVNKLRDECTPDISSAVHYLEAEILKQNGAVVEIENEISRLQSYIRKIQDKVQDTLRDTAESHADDFWGDDQDPRPEDFIRHVSDEYSYGAWRPFSERDRTKSLIDLVKEELADDIEELKQYDPRNED